MSPTQGCGLATWKKEIMTWSHLFHWQLLVVPAIFFFGTKQKEEPSFVYYDYIINTHKYSYFPVDPKFYVSLLWFSCIHIWILEFSHLISTS